MLLAKIVHAESQIAYLGQVYAEGEVEQPPPPEAYRFGSFVRIPRADGSAVIGVIGNTRLLNPDFGHLGPRLSTADELVVFAPDYLRETATVIEILGVGEVDGEGRVHQGIPLRPPAIDGEVWRLPADQVAAFHRPDGRLQLAYLPILLSQRQQPLIPWLVEQILTDLAALFPGEDRRLSLLRGHLAWQHRIQSTG